MIEIFKTNVDDHQVARMLVRKIHAAFDGYRANFDLHDCDKILRISCEKDIECCSIVLFVKMNGFDAERLH